MEVALAAVRTSVGVAVGAGNLAAVEVGILAGCTLLVAVAAASAGIPVGTDRTGVVAGPAFRIGQHSLFGWKTRPWHWEHKTS